MQNSSSEGKPQTPQDQKRERDRRELIDKLRRRIPTAQGVGCFLCKLIVEDFDKNGELTNGPKDFNGNGIFPHPGKIEHIKHELPTLDTVGA